MEQKLLPILVGGPLKKDVGFCARTCSGWAWGQDILAMPDFCQGSGPHWECL